nr:uncharacterized protein LOC111762836 [Dasypus novemcinctus]
MPGAPTSRPPRKEVSAAPLPAPSSPSRPRPLLFLSPEMASGRPLLANCHPPVSRAFTAHPLPGPRRTLVLVLLGGRPLLASPSDHTQQLADPFNKSGAVTPSRSTCRRPPRPSQPLLAPRRSSLQKCQAVSSQSTGGPPAGQSSAHLRRLLLQSPTSWLLCLHSTRLEPSFCSFACLSLSPRDGCSMRAALGPNAYFRPHCCDIAAVERTLVMSVAACHLLNSSVLFRTPLAWLPCSGLENGTRFYQSGLSVGHLPSA